LRQCEAELDAAGSFVGSPTTRAAERPAAPACWRT
jgi:hypothetical protein